MGNISAQHLILCAKELCWRVSPESHQRAGGIAARDEEATLRVQL
jgi:hypothetical protein